MPWPSTRYSGLSCVEFKVVFHEVPLSGVGTQESAFFVRTPRDFDAHVGLRTTIPLQCALCEKARYVHGGCVLPFICPIQTQ